MTRPDPTETRRQLLTRAYQRGRAGAAPEPMDDLAASSLGLWYVRAWRLGQEYREGRVVEPHCLVGCGCPSCRLESLVRGFLRGDSYDRVTCETCAAAPATIRLHHPDGSVSYRCRGCVDDTTAVPLAPVPIRIDGGQTPEERRQLAAFFAGLEAAAGARS